MICGLEPGMGCTLVLDPIVAREFVEKGFDVEDLFVREVDSADVGGGAERVKVKAKS